MWCTVLYLILRNWSQSFEKYSINPWPTANAYLFTARVGINRYTGQYKLRWRVEEIFMLNRPGWGAALQALPPPPNRTISSSLWEGEKGVKAVEGAKTPRVNKCEMQL